MRTCALGMCLVAAFCGCEARTSLTIDAQPVAHRIPVLLPAGPNQEGRAWDEMQAAWITLDRTEGVAPALNRQVLGRQAGVSSAHDQGPALVLVLETSDSMLWSLREKQLTLAKELVTALPKDVQVTVATVDWLARTMVEDGSVDEANRALDRVASVVSAGRFSPERLREPLARIAERVAARFVLFLGKHQADFLSLDGEEQDEQDEDDSKGQPGDWFFRAKVEPHYITDECRSHTIFHLEHPAPPIPDPLYPSRRWPDEAAAWSRPRQAFAQAYDRLLVQHRPWIQGCLRDEQNAAPGDPSVDAVLTVDASGAVRDIVMDGHPAYRGSRECLRSRLRSFEFPPSDAQGETQVRFTFARPGHDEGRGGIKDIACEARDDAKMQRQAAKFFGLSYWAHPAHLAWMAWAQNRQEWSDLIPTILVARLFHSAGISYEARRTLSEVASACPAVASHLASTWGFPDDASAIARLAAEDHPTDTRSRYCWDPPTRAGRVEYLRQQCPAIAECLKIR